MTMRVVDPFLLRSQTKRVESWPGISNIPCIERNRNVCEHFPRGGKRSICRWVVELSIGLDEDDTTTWVQSGNVCIHCTANVVDQVHRKSGIRSDAEGRLIGMAWRSIRVGGVQGILCSDYEILDAAWHHRNCIYALTCYKGDGRNIADQSGCCDQEEAEGFEHDW